MRIFFHKKTPQTKFVFEAKILKSHEILEALTKNCVYSIFTCIFVPKSINVAHQDFIHNK